jgi:DNA-binding transcriptional regulator/RsmH inhibitor MraZ
MTKIKRKLTEFVPSLEGVFEHTVDTKGRLVVPSGLRRVLVARARGIILADNRYTLDRFGIWYEGVLQYELKPSLDDARFDALVNDATHAFERKMRVAGEYPFEQLARKMAVTITQRNSNPYITLMLYLEARPHASPQEALDTYSRGKYCVQEMDAQHRILVGTALRGQTVTCIGMRNYIAVFPAHGHAEE